ncbi:MAG TPA: hypothetical protein VLF62_03395 [Candidatus Saccharimonadales bacterium]|nr:hypothetical protein [Candidatus Saccharimonadales bacterium]
MKTKTHNSTNRAVYISAALFLLPIILLVINRMLMLSGPGRGVPTFMLLTFTSLCPVLAIALSGSALYTSWRNTRKSGTSVRQNWLLGAVCLLSLVYLTLVILDHIRFYTLTH